MKKLLTMFLPLFIFFSLSGCWTTEYSYIKPEFREVWKVDRAGRYADDYIVAHQIKIDGKWYDADENGQLTDKGKKQKQMAESQSSDDDGGGGGGC